MEDMAGIDSLHFHKGGTYPYSFVRYGTSAKFVKDIKSDQNGFTITRMTMNIIRMVGTSFIMRQ
jgi:hypothetical protein